MQGDGNFVLYTSSGHRSGPATRPGTRGLPERAKRRQRRHLQRVRRRAVVHRDCRKVGSAAGQGLTALPGALTRHRRRAAGE